MEIEKQPLPVQQFRDSLALIKAGDLSEFEQVQYFYTLTIEQFNTLSEAHELATKSVQ